jgi:hypothetical protein
VPECFLQEAIGDKNKKIADLNAELNNWKSNGAANEARLLSAEEQLTERNKALELKTAEVSHIEQGSGAPLKTSEEQGLGAEDC